MLSLLGLIGKHKLPYNPTFRKLVDHEFKTILGYIVSFRLICAMRPGFKKVYICIYMYPYAWEYMYVYANMYTFVWTYACICVHIYLSISCKFTCTQMHMYRCAYTHMYIHVHMCIHKDIRICIHVHMNLHDGPHHTSDVPALCAILGTHMMYSHIIIFLFLRLAHTSACPWWILYA